MCGIIGVFDPQKILSQADFVRLRDLLRHRGPDDAGVYRDPDLPVFLGHRRLSILDLSPAGRQPMADPAETLWLTFNGEIYNFKELRKELEALGAQFRSHTDTEVILHGYRQWGEKVLERLEGMFAFCLYDRVRREFFFARDPVGIKPFYYAHRPGFFFFASEIQPITRSPHFKKELDSSALVDSLTFGYVAAPKTVWKGLRKLPAGHFGVFSMSEGSLRISPYWDFSFRPAAEEGQEGVWKERVLSALDRSVASHLVSDVPLGAFLSGGIDSSMVVASMARQVPGRVKTFSIGFNEAMFNEAPLAERLAERYRTDHHSETVDMSKVKERFETITDYFGEPFADSSSLPMDFLAEMTRSHVTVALSGDGGDELFGGYRRYLKMHYMKMGRKLPGLGAFGRLYSKGLGFWQRQKSFLHEIGLPWARAYASAMSKLPPDAVLKLLKPELLNGLNGYDPFQGIEALFRKAGGLGFDPLGCLRYVDAKTWLPEDVLTKVDRVTMRHSLEARVPLLDRRFIEGVQDIPERILLGPNVLKPKLKGLLKDLARDFLPAQHFKQPKRGFGLPIRKWFKDLLYEETSKIGQDPASPFQNEQVREILNLHRSGAKSFDEALWAIYVFEHWWRKEIGGSSL